MDVRITQLELGPMQNFVYLVGAAGAREAAVVDPAWDVPAILEAARREGREIVMALLSHHHRDHVNGVPELCAALPGIEVLAHAEELPRLSALGVPVKAAGDRVEVGPLAIDCIHTPGHTPGSQCFACGGALVSGDTLFIGGCGRCDFPGGDPHQMWNTLHHVLGRLPDDTLLYPGHNYASTPTSTLGRERRENPYLTRTAEDDFVSFRMRPRT